VLLTGVYITYGLVDENGDFATVISHSIMAIASREKFWLVSWLDANGIVNLGTFVEHSILHH
jgi:hypothetical protein